MPLALQGNPLGARCIIPHFLWKSKNSGLHRAIKSAKAARAPKTPSSFVHGVAEIPAKQAIFSGTEKSLRVA